MRIRGIRSLHFLLLNHHNVINVQTKKCKNDGNYTPIRMKVYMKVTKKNAREENYWIERKIYWTIRNTTIMGDRNTEKAYIW